MIRRLAALALAAALSACAATQTVYGPAGPGARDVGYDSLRIEDDRWRVTFTAGPDLRETDAERFALRRAAEIALDNGHDWFEVVDRSVERVGDRDGPVGVSGRVGASVGSGGYSASGVGIGIGVDGSRERRIVVRLEIIAGPAPAPDRPRVYDARQVLASQGRPV